DDCQILSTGIYAGGLGGDVSVSLARGGGVKRASAGALEARADRGGDRLPGNLGGLSLLVRSGQVCACIAAGTQVLRRARRCAVTRYQRAFGIHSGAADPLRGL